MLGFFKKKYKGIVQDSQSCTVNITEEYIEINGKRVEIPMHIDYLSQVLGEPREVKFKTADKDKAFLEAMHGKGMVTNRVNYIWDDLGIMCYTQNGKIISCLGIELNHGERPYPHTPKSVFKGTVTINGRHWLPVIKAGEDCEVLQRAYVGSYLITGEYVDIAQTMEERDERSYTGLEIQLMD